MQWYGQCAVIEPVSPLRKVESYTVVGYGTGYSTGKNMILKKYDKDGNHVD